MKRLICPVAILASAASLAATITTPQNGGEHSVVEAAIWSNNARPTSDNDYIATRTVVSAGDSSTVDGKTLISFPGKSLTVRKPWADSQVADFLVDSAHYGNTWLDFPRDGFALEGDVNFRYRSDDNADRTVTITGACFTVKSPLYTHTPTIRGMSQDATKTTTYAFRLPFKGPKDAVLTVNHHKDGYPGAARLEFYSDASEFFGRINILNNNSVGLFGNTFGGTVNLGWASSFLTLAKSEASDVCQITGVTASVTSARLVLSDDVTAKIGSLDFACGIIEVPNLVSDGRYAGGHIEVLDRVNLGGRAQVEIKVPGQVIPAPTGDDPAANDFVLLSAPLAAGEFSTGTFKLTVVECAGTAQTNVALKVAVDETAGVRKLIVRRRNFVSQIATDSSGTHGSSLVAKNAGNWTDGKLPHSGADYLIPSGNQLMTDGSSEENVFAGETLELPGTLVLNTRLVNKGHIKIFGAAAGGRLIKTFATASSLEGGVVEIYKSNDSLREVTVDCNANGSYGLALNSELCGNGILTFRHSGDTATHTAPYRLGGTNTHFTGRIWTSCDKTWNPSTMKRITLEFTDPSNFGDHRADLDEWAMKPTDAFVLRPTRSMTFTDDNCAATLQNDINFKVDEGIVLGFCHRYTFYPTANFHKTGTGTLGFGGSLWFIKNDDRVSTPQGTETVSVEAGWVCPLSESGADGLIFKFSDGAGIRLRCGLDESDPIRVYGLKNIKRATPFVTVTDGAKIPVAFDGVTPTTKEKLAVVTVADHATAAALKDRFVGMVGGVADSSVTFEVRDNQDGSATVVSKVGNKGLIITIR